MKLIFCPECNDVRKLLFANVSCECGKSWGKYEPDGLRAIIGGEAIPLGLNNASFVRALNRRPDYGPGEKFEAFVIEHNCPTIQKNT